MSASAGEPRRAWRRRRAARARSPARSARARARAAAARRCCAPARSRPRGLSEFFRARGGLRAPRLRRRHPSPGSSSRRASTRRPPIARMRPGSRSPISSNASESPGAIGQETPEAGQLRRSDRAHNRRSRAPPDSRAPPLHACSPTPRRRRRGDRLSRSERTARRSRGAASRPATPPPACPRARTTGRRRPLRQRASAARAPRSAAASARAAPSSEIPLDTSP